MEKEGERGRRRGDRFSSVEREKGGSFRSVEREGEESVEKEGESFRSVEREGESFSGTSPRGGDINQCEVST